MIHWTQELDYTLKEADLSKRFWICAHAEYEASGGMEDMKGSTDTLEEAKALVEAQDHSDGDFCVEEGSIYDSHSRKIVLRFENRHWR